MMQLTKDRQQRGLLVILIAFVAFTALVVTVVLSSCNAETPQARLSTIQYGRMNVEVITVTTTGNAGVAAGTGTTDGFIRGHLHAIHLDYAGTLTTTTDITVSLASPAKTVMYKLNSVTDAWYYPEAQATGGDGAAISGAYDRMPINGRLVVAVGSSTAAASAVVATIWWGD